jgi:hypothetical protein
VIYGETWGQVSSSWRKWYTEETANPMSLPVPVHHVDSGFTRKNLWRCLKRRRPRPRGEKLQNEATRSFVFSENVKKGVHVGGLLLLRSRSRQHPPSRKAQHTSSLLRFAFYSPNISGDELEFVRTSVCGARCRSHGIFEWSSIPIPKFVHPECTAMTNQIPCYALVPLKV